VRIGESILIDGEGDTISQGETVSKSGWLSNTITADPPQGAKYIKIRNFSGNYSIKRNRLHWNFTNCMR